MLIVLMNLRNCAMETTLSSSNFFPPYDYHQTAQISFILRRYIAAFKNCVTGGKGRGGGGGATPYNALHRGDPPEKGTIFGLQV